MGSQSVLIVGDTHFPFVLWRTIDRIVDAAGRLKPAHIIQVGDLFDLYSYSRFAKSLNIYTPRQEVKLGRKNAEVFWSKLLKAAPKAKCWQLMGNHDARPHKRLMETAPEFEDQTLPALTKLFQFDGVETMPSDKDELILNGVCYMHGFRKFGDHVIHNRMSTVTGHLHLGGVRYVRFGNKTMWELNAGFTANPNTVPMSYGPQRRFSTHTQGFGWVDELGPRFIPLPNP